MQQQSAQSGDGEARARRLETMAVRMVGQHYYGLQPSDDPMSALYEGLTSRNDLDRMQPEYSDPPLTQMELFEARARYLAGA